MLLSKFVSDFWCRLFSACSKQLLCKWYTYNLPVLFWYLLECRHLSANLLWLSMLFSLKYSFLIQQLILYSDRRWCPQSATPKAYYFAFKAKEKRNLVIPNCAKMQNNRISLRWHYPNQVMGQSVTAYSQPAPAGSPVVYKNTDFIQYFLFFL